MSTNWTIPTTIIQYPEDESHIPWHEDLTKRPIVANGSLLHIARQPRNDITMKTYFLRVTGFNFTNLPETISGVAVKLSTNRGGRVTDETIQLTFNEELVGENRAGLILDPTQVYGSETDTWDVENLTPEMIADPTFGITLRFRSHPHWPHKSTPMITALEMQIY